MVFSVSVFFFTSDSIQHMNRAERKKIAWVTRLTSKPIISYILFDCQSMTLSVDGFSCVRFSPFTAFNDVFFMSFNFRFFFFHFFPLSQCISFSFTHLKRDPSLVRGVRAFRWYWWQLCYQFCLRVRVYSRFFFKFIVV